MKCVNSFLNIVIIWQLYQCHEKLMEGLKNLALSRYYMALNYYFSQ